MNTRLFTDFTEQEIDFFIQHTKQKVLDPNTLVFAEGDNATCMYIIKSGNVEVFINRKNKDIELAKLSEGDFFGEMAILRQETRSASIKTLDKTELIVIDKESVFDILNTDGKLAAKFFFNLAEVLAERLATTNKEVENWFLINDALVENEIFRKIYFKSHKK